MTRYRMMRFGRPLSYLTVCALVALDLTVWHHMYLAVGVGVALFAVLLDTLALRVHHMQKARR